MAPSSTDMLSSTYSMYNLLTVSIYPMGSSIFPDLFPIHIVQIPSLFFLFIFFLLLYLVSFLFCE